LELLENSRNNIFISGRAGTGKSTLLRLFKETTKKQIVVLAPTGVAALNINGQTIHSFFRFPPGIIVNSALKKQRNRSIYKKLEVIVIDEISMVRADMLDNIDHFLRVNRDSPLPFGGIQMVFIGDLFQIPPVVSQAFEKQYISEKFETPYFFSSNVLKNNDIQLIYIELHEVFRQVDRTFINLLESIRMNEMDWDQLQELNARHKPEFIKEGNYITLCSRNLLANKINNEKLDEIDSGVFSYEAMIEGEFPESIFPTDPVLTLKVGAQIIFIRNDIDKKYVNGTIGKIRYLDNFVIRAEIFESGETREIEVYPEIWENTRYIFDKDSNSEIRQETMGTFNQYPIKLAWAITIHKSQGKTFDNVRIDMGSGAFTHGMTYVALSRCRTLEGIVLNTPINPGDIMVDNAVVEFLDRLRRN
jgi:ATP-dependent DNA helicase PIF1